MPTWIVKVDRRSGDPTPVTERLEELAESVKGLRVESIDDSPPDAGNFRDFAAVARIRHEQIQGLEVIAEQLISEFGWVIDLEKTS